MPGMLLPMSQSVSLTAAGRGRMAASLVGLAMAVFAPSSASAAGLDPSSLIPEDSLAVLKIDNPNKSLAAIERLALAAGMAPPGAQPGWLLSSLQVDVSSLDLSSPIWIGFNGSAGSASQTAGVAIAKVRKGREKTALSAFKGSGGKLRIEKGWLVAVNGEGQPASPKRAFRFPTSSKTVQRAADAVVHLDMAGLQAAVSEQEGMQEVIEGMGEDIEAMTVGLSLGESGVSIYLQQHPRFSSPTGKMMKASKNVRGPLVSGLPDASYGLVYGTATDSSYTAEIVNGMRKRMEREVTADNPEVQKLLTALFDLATDTSGDCDQGAGGVVVPADPNEAYFVSSSRCARPEAPAQAMPKLASVLNNELKAMAMREDDVAWDGKLVHTKAAVSAGKVSFSSLALEMGETEDVPELVRRPIHYATPDGKHFVMGWNASQKTLAALAAASKRDARTPLTAFSTTNKHLLTPRLAEGYVSLPALLGPFLTGELAPFRFVVSSLPPLGAATQRQPDGSWVTQVWLPNQVAQLAAFAMQMAGGGR